MPSHVVLTELVLDHAPSTFGFVSNPDVAANLGLRSVPTLQKTNEWIERSLADDCIWAFAVIADQRHAGNIIFDHYDAYLKTIRFSIYLGDALERNRGIGTMAIKAALERLFVSAAVRKVWLTVHEQNLIAIRAYEKAGFRVEGLLRDEFRLNGKYVNCLRMAAFRANSDLTEETAPPDNGSY